MTEPEFELTPPQPEAQGNAENEHFPTPPLLAAAALSTVVDLHWRRTGLQMGPIGDNALRPPFYLLEPGCAEAPFLDAAKVMPNAHRVGCEVRDIDKPFHGIDFMARLDYLDTEACDKRNGVLFKPCSYDLIITNPPFSLAQEFVERSLELVNPFGLVAMLLQTGIEASKKRVDFWRQHPFMVKYNLVPRPVFIKGGDMREYAIYVWPGPGLAAALRQIKRSWAEVRVLQWKEL